jgi:hypothetical protein
MTPEFMFKLGGSYRIPVIETDAGLRIRYDSGRPLFMVEELPRLATWMGSFDGGELLSTGSDRIVSSTENDWYPSSTIFDFSLKKDFNIGRGMGIGVSLDILNAFNENTPAKAGFTPGDYGRVYHVIRPRTTRLGVKFFF